MVEIGSATSRRALLSALAIAPIAAPSSWDAAIAALPYAAVDRNVSLRRSKQGRSVSRTRYDNAEGFFAGIEAGRRCQPNDQLYQIGIVTQLGLSSHLLDVGFDDSWCARYLGLNVGKSLAYANATGLGHSSPEFERLAAFLSPYGQWRNADLRERPCDCPFSDTQIRLLTRDLLERVREVTGHRRPYGWRQRSL